MESPFSWNCRYLSTHGFPCQITARAEDSKTLLAKISGIEAWLLEQGATPARPEVAPIAAQASAAQAEHGPEWCPIHQVAMKLNTSNDGRQWYSHKVDEGWCKGKRNGNGK